MTLQKSTASTSTGTVSRVSVFSARKDEAITRVSIQYRVVSTMGAIRNKPGPRSDWKRPSRRTMTLSQGSATLMESEAANATTSATKAVAIAAPGLPAAHEASAATAPTVAMKRDTSAVKP